MAIWRLGQGCCPNFRVNLGTAFAAPVNIGQAAQQPETGRANCTFESKARDNASGGPEGFLRRKFPKGAANAETAAKMGKNRLPLK